MNRIPLPRLFRAASFRLSALYVVIFAGSAFVLGAAVFLEAKSALQRQMTARIETETRFLREEFRAGGLGHLIAVVRTRGRGSSALDYLVQDRAGAHLAGEMPATAGLKPGWATIDVPQATEDGGGRERVRAFVSELDGSLLLAVGEDLRQIGELEEAIASAFLWTVGLAAALGISGGVLISRAFLRRVDAITRTAEAIIEGDLTRRVPVQGTGDDLDYLAGTLNRMLDRIAALMESLRQVSSDVAHDLRTPLSRLYQRLEDARIHARSVADYEAALDAALNEANKLLETFSALLRIAQVEGASAQAEFVEVNLSALTETVADAYRPDIEAAGHALTASIFSGVAVNGDRELLTQALANLVENALRHTPYGTRIAVRLEDRPGSGALLVVEDDGPGVAEPDLSRLTQRFYRAEQSRTTPGNGLGLTLVNAVADLHGATLDVTSHNPGLCVSLAFANAWVRKVECTPAAEKVDQRLKLEKGAGK